MHKVTQFLIIQKIRTIHFLRLLLINGNQRLNFCCIKWLLCKLTTYHIKSIKQMSLNNIIYASRLKTKEELRGICLLNVR
jgi:hypothetical protein